ncbi:hypothetical protein ACP70R_007084 [Stipagrostis hirtigluma subsp. patula]
MGACVSLSRSPPAGEAELGRVVVVAAPTAKVVDYLDGTMAQFVGPVTAREALESGGVGRGREASAWFVCSSDELRFDAPARALAAEEALRPGQLYFALPAPMLRRPLSGKEMAALAVKASTALAVNAGLVRRRKGGAGVGAAGKRRQTARRVAPLPTTVSGEGSQPEGGSWDHSAYSGARVAAFDGERTVGKTRHGARRRSGARHRAGVQRLTAIAEGSE